MKECCSRYRESYFSITFSMMDKECGDSWPFFFWKVEVYCGLWTRAVYISDRHASIANDIARVYRHSHHELCMRHLSKNLRKNFQCGNCVYLYYYAARAYSYSKFVKHISEIKIKCLNQPISMRLILNFINGYGHTLSRIDLVTTILWSHQGIIDGRKKVAVIFNSIVNKFAVKFWEMHAEILKTTTNFVPRNEKIIKKYERRG